MGGNGCEQDWRDSCTGVRVSAGRVSTGGFTFQLDSGISLSLQGQHCEFGIEAKPQTVSHMFKGWSSLGRVSSHDAAGAG